MVEKKDKSRFQFPDDGIVVTKKKKEDGKTKEKEK